MFVDAIIAKGIFRGKAVPFLLMLVAHDENRV